jgi:hypothetical protein
MKVEVFADDEVTARAAANHIAAEALAAVDARGCGSVNAPTGQRHLEAFHRR